MGLVSAEKLVKKINKKDKVMVLSYDGAKVDHALVKSGLLLSYYNYSYDISAEEFAKYGGYFTNQPAIKEEIEAGQKVDPELAECKFVDIFAKHAPLDDTQELTAKEKKAAKEEAKEAKAALKLADKIK